MLNASSRVQKSLIGYYTTQITTLTANKKLGTQIPIKTVITAQGRLFRDMKAGLPSPDYLPQLATVLRLQNK